MHPIKKFTEKHYYYAECTCTVPRSQVLPITITSSISLVLVLLTCGICGYYNLKQRRTIQNLSSHSETYNASSHSVEPTLQIPSLDTALYDQDKGPEMVENEAYGTYRPRAL